LLQAVKEPFISQAIPLFKPRALALIMAIIMATLCVAPDAHAKKNPRKTKQAQSRSASGTADPRYAAIIMNPITGEVYHQQDADERRYPASLTKMMTLYLLFEALEQKKISLSDDLEVSALAARQAQTNLSLDEGDEIEVETAIKALVVRSANDVSVAVAEKLGGDVEGFARKMTAKARALGMTGTVFRNPNGLPISGQYTTARDMAKLGIALKRDFPRYYRYFSTLQFSHNGVTYYTHNRVMLRYAGVDGIKTGFIGASGFNLVTSVVRGGRPLVGVVMGGSTGAWRDNRMIQLLDTTYDAIAKRGAVKGRYYPANLPLSPSGVRTGVNEASLAGDEAQAAQNQRALPEGSEPEDGVTVEALPPASLPEQREAVRVGTAAATPSPFAMASEPAPKPAPTPQPAPAKAAVSRAPIIVTPATRQTPSKSRVIEVSPAAPTNAPPNPNPNLGVPEAATVPAKPPETIIIERPAAAVGERAWGIQVGAFSSQALAVAASRSALQIAAKPLVSAKMALADPGTGATPVHRARLENLTQAEARKACEVLISSNSPCFIYKAAQ
jgi:D-alanyl-D-alanine carboxypeptidase